MTETDFFMYILVRVFLDCRYNFVSYPIPLSVHVLVGITKKVKPGFEFDIGLSSGIKLKSFPMIEQIPRHA